ncbi:hypothetical protein GE09DRAFT_1163308 [Coniochaeta sp. 2T2.1]|nr:hypothetical protein GE09DRAFT_1163308 [Coniochaeta sp. 2T2.1]
MFFLSNQLQFCAGALLLVRPETICLTTTPIPLSSAKRQPKPTMRHRKNAFIRSGHQLLSEQSSSRAQFSPCPCYLTSRLRAPKSRPFTFQDHGFYRALLP